MFLTSHIAPAAFSLAALACWGTSDFVGGYASRRANAFLVAAIANASGLIFVVTIAVARHSAFPSDRTMEWTAAAGLSSGVALALFYRALSTGGMGLIAPVSAVVGAAIPTAVGMFLEGVPHPINAFGFALAGVGIWLISRTEISNKEDSGPPEGLGSAVLAGIGFAGFFLCIKQAGNGSADWIAAGSRASSLLLTGIIVLAGRMFRHTDWTRIGLAAVAGCLDVSGSVLFVLACQSGRLDQAVVLVSLYPVITVLLARWILREYFTRWKVAGMIAALLAVPMISWQ
jgi:drug/metabolite transporter (DMT)-like permease